MAASKKSLMPEGFEKQVTPAQSNDLLAFLTRRGKYLPLDLRKAATIVSTQGMFYEPGLRRRAPDLPRLVAQDVRGRAVPAGGPARGSGPERRHALRPHGQVPAADAQVGGACLATPRRRRSTSSAASAAGDIPYGAEGLGLDDRPAPLRGRHGRGPSAAERRPFRRLHPARGRSRLEARVHAPRPADPLPRRHPKGKSTIERIELVKGNDESAPLVVAVTVEGEGEGGK